MGQMVHFSRPDGRAANGYLAVPSGAHDAPGIVLLEEWWGVTDQIKETADRLAGDGFRVVIPDLFQGRTAAKGDEANHLVEGLDFADAATQDARGAAQFLKRDGGKCGAFGFCMGGALAFLCALNDPEFDAAVSWYGIPPAEVDLTQIAIPLQGHFARHDTFFTIEYVNSVERAMKAAGRDVAFFTYDAKHGFGNDRPADCEGLGHYNRASAELAWERTLAFFNEKLRDANTQKA